MVACDIDQVSKQFWINTQGSARKPRELGNVTTAARLIFLTRFWFWACLVGLVVGITELWRRTVEGLPVTETNHAGYSRCPIYEPNANGAPDPVTIIHDVRSARLKPSSTPVFA